MLKSLAEGKSNSSNNRQFIPIFNRSPLNVNGSSKIESIDFTINKLLDDRAVPTTEIETIKADLVCRSIGYKSTCADKEINFDEDKGLVKHSNGIQHHLTFS